MWLLVLILAAVLVVAGVGIYFAVSGRRALRTFDAALPDLVRGEDGDSPDLPGLPEQREAC
jgi:hypothetical protein